MTQASATGILPAPGSHRGTLLALARARIVLGLLPTAWQVRYVPLAAITLDVFQSARLCHGEADVDSFCNTNIPQQAFAVGGCEKQGTIIPRAVRRGVTSVFSWRKALRIYYQ